MYIYNYSSHIYIYIDIDTYIHIEHICKTKTQHSFGESSVICGNSVFRLALLFLFVLHVFALLSC